MIGCAPPAVWPFAHWSVYSYAARATPTAATAATGPDQVNALLMTRSPLPSVPEITFSSGTRTSSKTSEAFEHRRWPILSITFSTRNPGVPRGTMIALKPSLPPRLGSVRAMHTFTLAPSLSQPAALHGQYLRPLSTYSEPRLSATRPMPTGRGWGASKLAVPPGWPAGSLTTQPARYFPVGSLVAGRSHFSFSAAVPNQTTFIRPRPLTRMVVAKPGSTVQMSSATSMRSRLLTPPPPYSRGRKPMASPRLYAST